MTPVEIALTCAALAVAGVVKGMIGFGIPLVSIALLTMFLPLQQAVALLPVPMVVANIFQSFHGAHFPRAMRRFWPLVIAVVLGTVLGGKLLVSTDPRWLELTVGIAVVVFSVSTYFNPALALPERGERPVGVAAGFLGGTLGGMSTLFGPPIIMYLTSLRLDRETFVGSISTIYLCCSITLVLVLTGFGAIGRTELISSAFATAPLLLGMFVGQRIRGLVEESQFRRVLVLFLLVVGLRLVYRAVV